MRFLGLGKRRLQLRQSQLRPSSWLRRPEPALWQLAWM
jgi:hypothetical protein